MPCQDTVPQGGDGPLRSEGALNPASTLNTSFSFGHGEFILDMSGLPIVQGQFIEFQIVSSAVHEPGTMLLSFGGAAVLFGALTRRRRRA